MFWRSVKGFDECLDLVARRRRDIEARLLHVGQELKISHRFIERLSQNCHELNRRFRANRERSLKTFLRENKFSNLPVVIVGDVGPDRRHAQLRKFFIVADTRLQDDAWLIDLALPDALLPLMVAHGSVTVNGVSLTVNALLDDGIQLSIIEYTRRHTTLGDLAVGASVHVEADVLAKHVERLLAPQRARLPDGMRA